MHPANPQLRPEIAAFRAWNERARTLNARPDPRTEADAAEEARCCYEADEAARAEDEAAPW